MNSCSAESSAGDRQSSAKKKYRQRFRDQWLNIQDFRKWLKRDNNSPYKCTCTICDASLVADLGAIKRHSEGSKHKLRLPGLSSQVRTIDDISKDQQNDSDECLDSRERREEPNHEKEVKFPTSMKPFSRGGFAVTWGHYSSVMCAGFQELQQRGEFVDMTIAADGHLVRTHQMVVGLASPFLKEMLRSAPSPHPILFLNNVSHDVLCCLLEYMYTGEAFVPGERLKDFITTGKALHVRGLEDSMEPDSKSTLVEQAPEVLKAATALTRVANNIRDTGLPKASHSDDQNTSAKIKTYETLSPNQQISPQPEHVTEHTLPKRGLDIPDVFSTPPKVQKLNPLERETETLEETLSAGEDMLDDNEKVEYLDEFEGTEHMKSTLNSQGTKAPDLAFTVSNQGGIQLILNRFMFRMRNKYKDGRRRWQCIDSRRTSCPAIVVTSGEQLLYRGRMHNHPFHDKKIMAKVSNDLVFASLNVAEGKNKM